MQITLDKTLRREIKTAAKMQVFARLPYCIAIMLIYALPALILGLITAVPMDASWPLMLAMFGVSMLCEILILGPIMLGVQYALIGVARNEPQNLGIVFSPLGSMRELLRGMRMMLCMVVRFMLLAAVPTGLYLGAAHAISRWTELRGIDSPETAMFALVLLLLFYSLMLLPLTGRMLSYSLGYALLHDNPDMGVWRATAEAARLLRGQRRGMTLFALSFMPWFIGGMFTCGVLFMFGSVYMNVSAFMLLGRLRAAQDSPAQQNH